MSPVSKFHISEPVRTLKEMHHSDILSTDEACRIVNLPGPGFIPASGLISGPTVDPILPVDDAVLKHSDRFRVHKSKMLNISSANGPMTSQLENLLKELVRDCRQRYLSCFC